MSTESINTNMKNNKEKSSKKKKKTATLKKVESISSPSGFQHVVHGVWDPVKMREYTTLPRGIYAKDIQEEQPRRTSEPTEWTSICSSSAAVDIPESFQILDSAITPLPRPHLSSITSRKQLESLLLLSSPDSQSDMSTYSEQSRSDSLKQGMSLPANTRALPFPPQPCGSVGSSDSSKSSKNSNLPFADTGVASGKYAVIATPSTKAEAKAQQTTLEQVRVDLRQFMDEYLEDFRLIVRAEIEMSMTGKPKPERAHETEPDTNTYVDMKSTRRSQILLDDNPPSSRAGTETKRGSQSPAKKSQILPPPRDREHSDTYFISDGMQLPTRKSQRTSKPTAAKRNQGRLRDFSADDREYVAMAFQSCIMEFTENLQFSDLLEQDCLIPYCLTNDELVYIQRAVTNTDQIRQLISLLKGRDICVLRHFLLNVKRYEPRVVEAVDTAFLKHREINVIPVCAVCLLTSRVDVKYVVDSVWKLALIPDSLYNDIVQTTTPIGAQVLLWKQLFSTESDALNPRLREIVSAIIDDLCTKRHYSYIADKLRTSLNTYSLQQIVCTCDGADDGHFLRQFFNRLQGRHNPSSLDIFRDAAYSRASDDISRLCVVGQLQGSSFRDTDEYKIKQWRMSRFQSEPNLRELSNVSVEQGNGSRNTTHHHDVAVSGLIENNGTAEVPLRPPPLPSKKGKPCLLLKDLNTDESCLV